MHFGHNRAPLCGNLKFHTTASSAAFCPHQAVPLQRAEISQQCSALHSEPFTQFCHPPSVFGLQRSEDWGLSGANAVSPHLCVKELRYHPRYTADIKTC